MSISTTSAAPGPPFATSASRRIISIVFRIASLSSPSQTALSHTAVTHTFTNGSSMSWSHDMGVMSVLTVARSQFSHCGDEAARHAASCCWTRGWIVRAKSCVYAGSFCVAHMSCRRSSLGMLCVYSSFVSPPLHWKSNRTLRVAMVSDEVRRGDDPALILIGRYGRSGVSYRPFSRCDLGNGAEPRALCGYGIDCSVSFDAPPSRATLPCPFHTASRHQNETIQH